MSQHSFLQGITDHGFNVGTSPLPRPILHEHNLLGEELFLRTLSVERKRTERSGTPFALVLIDELDTFREEERVFERVESAVCSWLPAIDVAGWFSRFSCVGIICAEIGQGNRGGDAILAGLKSALAKYFGPAELARLTISVHQFPKHAGDDDHTVAMQFYPDVPERERTRQVSLWMKRTMDVVGSIAALVVFTPVFLSIALMIKLTSKG